MRVVDLITPTLLDLADREEIHEQDVVLALMYHAAAIYLAANEGADRESDVDEFLGYARPLYGAAEKDIAEARRMRAAGGGRWGKA